MDPLEELLREVSITPENARRIRMEAGISQQRMAQALGVNRVTLIRWEQGVRPRASHLRQWMRLLQMLDNRAAA